MSMQITMAKEYSTVTTYYGQLDKEYAFMVETSYNSEVDNHHISSVEFIAEGDLYNKKSKKYWMKAESKVRDFVTKWLFERIGGEDDSEV